MILRPEPDRRSMYEPGQLVRHVRYGYRGVVVSADPECRADEAWYQANNTQPDRDQPWYHVLVHGTEQVTYAAATSLDVDLHAEPIQHPLVALFFSAFEDGHYVRNERPWPSA